MNNLIMINEMDGRTHKNFIDNTNRNIKVDITHSVLSKDFLKPKGIIY
jgi:hypothetical protein